MKDHRHFAIVLALARHALYAAAALPEDHAQRRSVHWQVQRLQADLAAESDPESQDRAAKLGRLIKWFEDGAVPSGDIVVLSET